MKAILRLEESGFFLFSIYMVSTLGFSWWLFPLLLFVPDLSMIGYIRDSKLGAIIYYFFHFRALALLLFMLGIYSSLPMVPLIGVILLAHSSLDGVFGYGLKFSDSFGHTHLGKIGKMKETESGIAS
ncbi:MAG: DUF4260 domain-containing protein [Anaerolineales bacterium]|jgi:hypothetical protein